MKKVLSLVLAIMMVLSSMVFVVSADDAPLLTTATASPEVLTIKEDALIDYPTLGANSYGIAALINSYKLEEAIDVTKFAYFKFDIEITNAAIMKDVTLNIELTSSGKNDDQEWQAVKTLDELTGGLQEGLNTAVLAMGNANKALNRAAFNYTRFFTNGFTVPDGETAGIVVKNIRFEKAAAPDTDVLVVKEDALWTANLTAGEYGNAAFNSNVTVDAVDVSAFDYFKFDVEVTGAEALKAANFGLNIELTSGYTCDKQEWQVNTTLDSLLSGGLQDGLNTVVLNMADAGADLNECGFDYTRIFTNPFTIAGDASVVVKNIRFEKTAEEQPTEEDEALTDTYAFTVYDATEEKYLVRTTAGAAGDKRFSDGTLETVYKFKVTNPDVVTSVKFKATVWGQLLLQLSTDSNAEDSSDVEWTDVYTADHLLDQGEMEFDLTALLVDENGTMQTTFYIRFADYDTSDGCGGSICTDTPATLTVAHSGSARRYSFRVDEEKTEDKYLIRCSGQTNAGCRFNDEAAETVYKFTIKDTSGVKNITWFASLGGQLLLQFTTDDASKTSDGLNWVDVYKYIPEEGAAVDAQPDLTGVTYDLTELLVNADGSLKAETFYLRIADSVQPGGWGGNILTKVDQYLLVKADAVEAPEPEEEEKVSEFTNAVLKYTATLEANGMYCFTTISHPNYEIKDGDYLMYEVRIDAAAKNAHLGSVDMNFDDGSTLRDSSSFDQNGVNVHPAEIVSGAKDGVWFTRTVSLANNVGKTIKDFQLCMHPEGKADAGTFTALYDNIIIYNASGAAKCVIYTDDTSIDLADFNESPKDGASSSVENVECPEYEHEYVIFTPLDETETEKPYLVETTAGNNGNCRFSDNAGYTIYKFDISNYLSVEKVNFTAVLGQQMLFSVSMDGTNWTEIYKWIDDAAHDASAGSGWKITEHTLDLTNGVDFSVSNTIWIKIEDSYPSDGWGGSIYNDGDAMLDVWYVKLSDEELDAYEAKATEHKIPVFGCNTAFGGWAVDKDSRSAGSASLTKSVGQGSADSISFDAVNATGMDTLEFDVWVSDTRFFELFAQGGMDSAFELTSSGKYDDQEISWNLASIASNNQGDAIVANSWCHIVLPISTASTQGDAFNIANVNFIRFFFVNETADTGITLKIDNIVLTDYMAQLDAAAQKEAEPAIEKMNGLKGLAITDDNYKSAKSDITKARRAYDNLSDSAKAKVPAEVLKYLTDAEAARDAYEAAKDTPTEEPTPSVTAEPTGEDVTTAPTAEPTTAPTGSGSATVIIIVVVVVVVLAVAACLYFFVFKKKK